MQDLSQLATVNITIASLFASPASDARSTQRSACAFVYESSSMIYSCNLTFFVNDAMEEKLPGTHHVRKYNDRLYLHVLTKSILKFLASGQNEVHLAAASCE